MSIESNLVNASVALEALVKKLDTMTRAEKVDVAARLKAVSKNCDAIDELVKEDIKKARKGKAGYVNGDLFKAYLDIVPTTRLNQKKLEVEEPNTYAKYLETKDQQRVTFEPR